MKHFTTSIDQKVKKTLCNITNFLKYIPKKLYAVIALFLALIVIPFASSGAASVRLEGAFGVANVTRGDTKYVSSVDASYDQVVKYEVYYHNMEQPDSGKIAENLRVKIDLPTGTGKTQVAHARISADNASNVVNDTATVNLTDENSTLDFIPGSVVWRHNTGTNENINWTEQKLPDSIVTASGGTVIENEKPCYNFSATITFLARVHVPGISVVKQVRVKGTSTWLTNNTANPSDTLEYLITYKNMGNEWQNNVVIRDNLPVGFTLVPSTTYLANTTNPSGVLYNSDNLANGGIVVGNYSPGAAAYIKFDVKVPSADQLACGVTEHKNVGIAKPEGMNEFYNVAVTTINKPCAPTPAYTCSLLTVSVLGDRRINATVTYTATNGATFQSADFNFGDGTADVVTTNTTVQHTYAADGNYNASVTLTFMVNGQLQTATSASCAQPVSFSKPPQPPPTPPTPVTPGVLPSTGIGETAIGLFVGVTLASIFAYRAWISRQQ